MKRMLAVVVAVVAASTFALAAPVGLSPQQQEVRQANAKYFQVCALLDLALFNEIVADDAVFVGDDNKVRTKEQEMAAIASIRKLQQVMKVGFKVRDIKVLKTTIHGATGILVGEVTVSGGDKIVRGSFVNVFVKNGKSWQLVANIAQKSREIKTGS